MPNHLHAILVLTQNRNDSPHTSQAAGTSDPNTPGPRGTTPGSIGAIIQSFKKTTTRKIRHITCDPEFPVWQRDYYDHLIRDHRDLLRIRAYNG